MSKGWSPTPSSQAETRKRNTGLSWTSLSRVPRELRGRGPLLGDRRGAEPEHAEEMQEMSPSHTGP